MACTLFFSFSADWSMLLWPTWRVYSSSVPERGRNELEISRYLFQIFLDGMQIGSA